MSGYARTDPLIQATFDRLADENNRLRAELAEFRKWGCPALVALLTDNNKPLDLYHKYERLRKDGEEWLAGMIANSIPPEDAA